VSELMDPWESLPTKLGAPFRAELPRLAELITVEIQRRVPEFAQSAQFDNPAQSAYGLNIRLGVQRALGEFADRLTEARGALPEPDGLESARAYRALGRGEAREGRALDALQSAFRPGARIAWQCLAEVGAKAGVPPERMYRVAEAVFVYVEELADHTREGYAEAQARLDGEIQRRRERLLELLARVPGPSRAAADELARAARWPLPTTVRMVALRRPDGEESGFEPWPPALHGAEALMYAVGPEPFLLVPDGGSSTRQLLERALAGWTAAVGPPVPLAEAGTSLRWSRRLLDLAARGFGDTHPTTVHGVGAPTTTRHGRAPAAPLLHCLDHLPALILLEDEALIRTLIDRRLAPLQAAAPQRRDRLAETLLCWLECRGSAPEVARRLGIHPQTVRYRVRHLNELFGDGLTEPQTRYELELALRGRALLASLSNGHV